VDRYKLPFYLAVGALLVSLALHVWSWRARASTGSTPPAAQTATSPASPSAAQSSDGAELARCRAELEGCRRRGWQLVEETIREDVEQRRSEQPASADEEPAATDWAAQQQALCNVGVSLLENNWSAARQRLVAALAEAGTPQWYERVFHFKYASLRESGVDPEALEEGYQGIIEQQGAALREAATAEPIDFEALLTHALEFYAAEDRLIDRTLGGDARARHRANELEVRSAIIAGLAYFADVPYDESLAW